MKINKIIYTLLNFLLLCPNYIFKNKKTTNISQVNNKIDMRKKGFFFLSRNFLKKEKDFLLSLVNQINIQKIISEKVSDPNNLSSNRYTIDLLEKNYLKEIDKNYLKDLVFNNKELNDEISSSLGFKCNPVSLNFMLNFSHPQCDEHEGPKQWHRDNSSAAGQVKLFFLLNEIDETTGGHFHFLPLNLFDKTIKFFKVNDSNPKINLWNRFRYKDTEIKDYVDLEKKIVYPNYDNKGNDILIINTNDCYHKGGHIKKTGSYRLLLHIVYDPFFSFSDQKGNYFCKRIFTFIKNSLRKKILLN